MGKARWWCQAPISLWKTIWSNARWRNLIWRASALMANSKALPKLMDTTIMSATVAYSGNLTTWKQWGKRAKKRKPPQMQKMGLAQKDVKKSNGKMQYYYKSCCALVITCRFCILHPCQPTGGLSCIGKRKPKQRREACFLMKMMAAANGGPSAGREKSRSRWWNAWHAKRIKTWAQKALGGWRVQGIDKNQ